MACCDVNSLTIPENGAVFKGKKGHFGPKKGHFRGVAEKDTTGAKFLIVPWAPTQRAMNCIMGVMGCGVDIV